MRQVTYRRIVDLAGIVVDLAAETPEQATCLEWHFGRLPGGNDHTDLRIDLRRAPCPHPESPPSLLDGPITRWHGPSSLHLWHELGMGGVLTGSTLVVGGEPPPDGQWRAARQLLFSALSVFLDQRDLLVLHGAMIGRDGDAALVLGGSGCGKSTVAMAGLRSGWELLSDDLVVVRADPAGPTAFGIPKRVSIAPELAGQTEAPLQPLPGDDRGRVMLPASALTVGWRRIRALIRTDHHDGDGALQPMSHDDALASVVGAFLEAPRTESLRRHLGRLAALAARPAFVLAHTADADRRLDRATDLLHKAWHSST